MVVNGIGAILAVIILCVCCVGLVLALAGQLSVLPLAVVLFLLCGGLAVARLT